MHKATQEVERRVARILASNPELYGQRTTRKAVQAQIQIELLWDISDKLSTLHKDNITPEVIIPFP